MARARSRLPLPRLLRRAFALLCCLALVSPLAGAQSLDELLDRGDLDDLIQEGLERLSEQDLGVDAGAAVPTASEGRPGAVDRLQAIQRQAEAALVEQETLRLAREMRPLTPIERGFSERAGVTLRLVGYDAFGVAQPVLERQTGTVQDSYVLGPGDQIVVVLRGQVNRTQPATVTREGTIVLPELPPIPAAGLRFGEFRELLQEQIGQTYIATQSFVTLASVRLVSVLINGEVRVPGIVSLSGLGTIIDAIFLAGGIEPTGSLRDIQLVRDNRTMRVDLYDLILAPSPEIDLSITEGDRVFVPVIGATVAVTGQVKRPGIFELPAGEDALSAAALLELGGGTLGRAGYRFQVLRLLEDGREQLVEITALADETIRDGDILFVEPIADVRLGQIELAGHVTLPGAYPVATVGTVAGLIDRESLLPEPYLPFAVIETTDPVTLARSLSGFSLRAVLEGRADLPLASDDRVYVLGRPHLDFLTSAGVQRALTGEVPRQAANCAGLDHLARWVASNPEGELASSQFGVAARDLRGGSLPCPALFHQAPELLTYLLRNSILLRGNVLRPGIYPIAQPDQVDEVMAIAGATGANKTPLSGVSIVAATAGVASAQDVLEVEEPRVTLVGHVRFPGSRRLEAAPTLAALLGGLETYEEDPYLLFGLISRVNPATLQREVVPFSPTRISAGQDDAALADGDVVRIFGAAEMRRLVEALTVEGGGAAARPPANDAERRLSDEEALRQALAADEARAGGAAGADTLPVAGTQALLAQLADPGGSERTLDALLGTADGQALLQEALAGGTIDEDLLARAVGMLESAAPQAGTAAAEAPPAPEGRPDPALPDLIETFFPQPLVANLLRNSAVDLLGEVLLPGRYPVAGTVTLEAVMLAGGGLGPQADLSAVELTRQILDPAAAMRRVERATLDLRAAPAAAVALQPGDVVRVNRLMTNREEGFVELVGEVRRPGSYDIVQGERLSSVLARAGGLTPTAYPFGAVFTRESVRQAELQANSRFLQDLNRSIIGLMATARQEGIDISFGPEDVRVLQVLLAELQLGEAVGRMVVEADPNVLQVRPDLDIVLEPGDRLVVPRRPLSVFISGQVFNPGAQQFRVDHTVADYVEAAGGVTDQADRSTIFVIQPNGRAERASLSAWRSDNTRLLPGSTVVVPTDLTPFSFLVFSRTVLDILNRAAVSTASLAVLADLGDD